jgi:hypothetical protein
VCASTEGKGVGGCTYPEPQLKLGEGPVSVPELELYTAQVVVQDLRVVIIVPDHGLHLHVVRLVPAQRYATAAQNSHIELQCSTHAASSTIQPTARS